MKYTRNPQTVDAWRVGDETERKPDWLRELIRQGLARILHTGEVIVETEIGSLCAGKGKFIVRDSDGLITVLSEQKFHKEYSAI